MEQKKQHVFHVIGMHCASCGLLIEHELVGVKNVERVNVSVAENTITVSTLVHEASDVLAERLSSYTRSHGYEISVVRGGAGRVLAWGEFKVAVPVALTVIVIFLGFQKLGIVNFLGGGEMSLPLAFGIGVVASLSTCMALVGGLILSISATAAKDGRNVQSQTFFHAGRIIGFATLGGVLGILGRAFQLTPFASGVLNLTIAFIMLALGLNLLGIFPWASRLSFRMPESFSRRATGAARSGRSFAPFLAGIATFFLPCGFTQSVQAFALGTGSFVTGASTMLAFALGTFPMLALVSFGAFAVRKSERSGAIFRAIGIVVLFFAVVNVLASLSSIGLIAPVSIF